jgi:hypothetical protein
MTSRGKSLDVEELVLRSKEGKVSDKEIEQVAVLLRGEHDDEQTYGLLYVIGRSLSRSHEELVAGFLEHRDHPTVARLALQILCNFWDLTEKYLDQMQRFIDGVDWDDFGEVRQMAISSAGYYLRDHRRGDLLSGLLKRAALDNDDALERRFAIEAIATALGYPIVETLKGKEPWEQWAAEVLAQGQTRLATEGA